MIRLFNDNKPYVLFLLPFLSIFLFLLYYLNAFEPIPEVIDFGLWGKVKFTSNAKITWLLFGIIANLSLSILLNYIFNHSSLIERNDYSSSLLFTLFLAISPSSFYFNGLHMGIIGLLLSIYQFLQLEYNTEGTHKIFNGFFFYGFSVTIFPSLIFGAPFLVMLIQIFRIITLKELLGVMLALLIPLYFVFAYRYYFDFDFPFQHGQTIEVFQWFSTSNLPTLILLILILISTLNSMLKLWQNFSNRSKKEIQFLIGFFVILLIEGGLHFIFNAFSFHEILLIVPASFLFNLSFIGKKNKFFPTLLFYCLLGFIVTKFIFKL